ncbi:MAG: peptide-methionine (S)-S-oxide reductase MsrA [Promethearchaeota archaeon]
MKAEKNEKALFALGCFWGAQEAYRTQKGVISTRVGYTGGHFPNPTYKDVCSDKTGHAEAVEVIFDPSIVSYEELLDLFWDIHDPTTPNRQGWDVGSQYRSAIFYVNEKQREKALKSKERMERSGRFKKPIVTEVTKAKKFFEAEAYHQLYVLKKKKHPFIY